VGRLTNWNYAKVSSVTFPKAVTIPENSTCVDTDEISESCDSTDSETLPNLEKLSQGKLNDLIRDLELTKEKSEILASRMKQHGFLNPNVKTAIYRSRHEKFSKFFTKQDSICFCNNIGALFNELNVDHKPMEWRLFIDGSKESLKVVLLHNGNEKPSLPIAHAVNTKESYETMEALLKLIKYNEFQWKICADLKVVGMVCGLQGGYTKNCCFLCLWDSRADSQHYVKKKWEARKRAVIGKNNIKYNPIVKKENIILPPLHIKLGLVKNFVKALNKESTAFTYLISLFPALSYAKIKEGVFAGPEIKKLLKDNKFITLLSSKEAAAWKSFKLVVENFLGNSKAGNYKSIVRDLLKNYKAMGKLLYALKSNVYYVFVCF